MTDKQAQFERNYRKAYAKLLTAAANVPRQVDEYFFGPASDRDEESAAIRPFAYAFVSFCLAIAAFMHATIN